VERGKRQSLLVLVIGLGVLVPLFVVSDAGTAFAGKTPHRSTTTTTGSSSSTTKPPKSSTTTAPKSTTTTAPKTTSTATSTTASTIPVSPGDPIQSHVPDTIANDCSADVTSQLLAWINSVPDNAVLTFDTGACYEIEGVLMVSRRNWLTFDGNGATFEAKTDGASSPPPAELGDASSWPRRRAHWFVLNSTNITITNLTVIGNDPYTGMGDAQYNPSYEKQSGVVVNASSYVTLTDLTISKVWGDFVSIEKDASHVTVRNGHFTTSGRQGIAITSGTHIVIDGNAMDDVRWGMFDLEPNGDSAVIDDVQIINNVTGTSRWFWFASIGPSVHVSNIDIEYNHMTGYSYVTAIYVNNKTPTAGLRGPWTIAHNDMKVGWTTYGGFEFHGAGQLSIHDNVVHILAMPHPIAVKAADSDHLQVHDNDFTGTSRIIDPGNTTNWCEINDIPADLSQNVPC